MQASTYGPPGGYPAPQQQQQHQQPSQYGASAYPTYPVGTAPPAQPTKPASVCNMTRHELDAKLKECGYGSNEAMFSCYFVRELQTGALPLCAACRHPIGDHGENDVAAVEGMATNDVLPGATALQPEPPIERTSRLVCEYYGCNNTAKKHPTSDGQFFCGTHFNDGGGRHVVVVNNNNGDDDAAPVVVDLPTGVEATPEGYTSVSWSRVRMMLSCMFLFMGFMGVVTTAPNPVLMEQAPYAIIPGIVIAFGSIILLLTMPIYRVVVPRSEPGKTPLERPVRVWKLPALVYLCRGRPTVTTTARNAVAGLETEATSMSVNRSRVHVVHTRIPGCDDPVPLFYGNIFDVGTERRLWEALFNRVG